MTAQVAHEINYQNAQGNKGGAAAHSNAVHGTPIHDHGKY